LFNGNKGDDGFDDGFRKLRGLGFGSLIHFGLIEIESMDAGGIGRSGGRGGSSGG
jgi:hypothetical protein